MTKIVIWICLFGSYIDGMSLHSDKIFEKRRKKRDLFIDYSSYDPMAIFLKAKETRNGITGTMKGNIPRSLTFYLNEFKHMDNIVFKKPGVTSCADPCTIKCFHWINSAQVNTSTPFDRFKSKHPYYFPSIKDKHGNIKSRIGDDTLFNQGPNLLESGATWANDPDRKPMRQFKQYRFFSKEYNADKDMVNWKAPFWNAYFKPSAANWSYTIHDLANMEPSEWPQDFLGKGSWQNLWDGNAIYAYGKNVGPQGSTKVAERAQEFYDHYYSDTDLAEILGCDPFDRKSCRDISKSYPIDIGHWSPRLGDKNGKKRMILPIHFGPPGKHLIQDPENYRPHPHTKGVEPIYNGPGVFFPLVSYIAAGSWLELGPRLSRVNELLQNQNRTIFANYNKVFPGFGISNTPKFSSQGYHHNNFLSMSGSWVGKNNRIPQIKFNVYPDITNRLQGVGGGQTFMPLAYTSHVSSMSGSSASLDKRRSFAWVENCNARRASFDSSTP